MYAEMNRLKQYIQQNEKALRVYKKANLFGRHNNKIQKLEMQIKNANRKLKNLS